MRRHKSLLGEMASDLLKTAFGTTSATMIDPKGDPRLEYIKEVAQDHQVQREIMIAKADGSAYEGGNRQEQMVLEEVLQDYNEFDVEYAKGCVKAVANMMVNAYKDHPKEYSIFEKLCNKQAVDKIRRSIILKRINWHAYAVEDVQVIRYNPNPICPSVIIKANIRFEQIGKKSEYIRFSFFYSCIEGAKTCTHCGGIIEDQLVDKCPYCDYIVTDSATEKAWKITDVRQLS